MISKAMILGAAAAVVATGTGFYVATSGDSSPCKGGCPISAMFETKKSEGEGGSCCAGVNKASALAKVPSVETPTLAACVGGGAYATTKPVVIACCADD